MTDDSYSLVQLVNQDPRYPVDAYWFVREALAYAADSLELGASILEEDDDELELSMQKARRERHLTGQQLCEAIRQYALNQYGYMANVVLKSWNIDKTDCFGDIVYNMISIGLMKKSSEDRKSHFDNVFDFEDAFENNFQICASSTARRTY
ncbi:MAG: Minf_1886 family protein [Planctomycetota bacterium]